MGGRFRVRMMKKIIFLMFAGLVMVSCAGSSSTIKKKSLDAESAKNLSEHSKEFRAKVYKVGENVYSAVGFGLANSILIDGKDGLIIVDTMESVENARMVLGEFKKISDKPVKAIIYTHNHVDHVLGAKAMADQGDHPEIYAHETLHSYVQRLANKMRPVIGTRSMRMFGNYLDEQGLVNAGIGPYLGINDRSTSGYLRPTKTFSDTQEIIVAGVRLQLIHAPGETDDQIYVYLPDQNLLICADNFYKSFPNLYTIRGTMFRSFENWYKSIDLIRDIRPEYLVPCHGKPLFGAAEIYSAVTDYRDAIQFVHDQGIRGMNQGMTPDELVEYVKLPQNLQQSPYLKEFYGSVSWSLRSLFSGNLGWFSGDSADLNPLSRKQKALLAVKLAGDEKSLFLHAIDFYEKQKYQEALELTGHLLYLNPENPEIRKLRVDTLMALGSREENANARHYYLTEAAEIRDKFLAREGVKITMEQLSQMPLEAFFSMLAVNLDPVASSNMKKTVGMIFADVDKQYAIYLRNGVAEIQGRLPDNPDILAVADSLSFKAMLAGLKSPVTTLAGFSYKKGNAISMGLFLKLFEPPPQKLPCEPFQNN
jgi:alkyl sulfatase BDS1-like metallo-beta-lactamase superfamily hydrolase